MAAALTIIQAWRRAGMLRAEAGSIVTFRGSWSDYCRYPLMWLGQPNPAMALLEQVRHDPDGEALSSLMTEWRSVFGSTATTVRKAVETALKQPNLLDAMREFNVEERGEINRSKLGWLLKKNVDRIVGGYKFQQTEADGRTAWRVLAVKSPSLRPSPPFTPPIKKTVTPAAEIEVEVEVSAPPRASNVRLGGCSPSLPQAPSSQRALSWQSTAGCRELGKASPPSSR